MTNKRCLIYETLGKVTNLQVSEAAAPQGMMRLEGVFGVCGIKNQNNRVYDKENYKQMVESLQKTIKEPGCPGELEHPNSMNINLENVSHKIEDIQMNEDGTITGTILLLNTPKGQIAQAIVEGGLPLYISSRGAGTITNEGKVTLSTIKTYDLVGTPGFSQAKLTLKQNQTLECLNESADDGNLMYAIVEGDDLLGDDSGDSEKKEEKPKEEKPKDDKSKDEKSEDTSKEEKPKEEPKKEEPKKEDNKNNDNDKVDMKDLKEAIDKLSEKVNSLEAELHVAQESLEEVQSIKPTNYDAIQQWVTEEFWPNYSSELSTGIDEETISEMISNKIDESLNNICEGVQNWVVEEFAPEVQNWVCEEFAPEVQNWVCEEFAPEVQNWVCEEFAPEVQNWVCEEFAPEVQNWITEEYSPEVQGWITEEFAPEVQNWITEEFSPVLEGWITEEFSPVLENKINESSSVSRLNEIDSLLESLAQDDNADVNKIVKEEKESNKWKGIYVVENMPTEYMPSWNLLEEGRQQEIIRTSKMYDFTKEGVLESFWANVDFNQTSAPKQISESVDPISNFQMGVIQRMKYLRGYNV